MSRDFKEEFTNIFYHIHELSINGTSALNMRLTKYSDMILKKESLFP
jgi:hypothetical protein